MAALRRSRATSSRATRRRSRVRIRGGLQPSRVAGAVNPLAHVEADAVVLSSLGAATERFLQAVAVAFDQEVPPPPIVALEAAVRQGARPSAEARFAALLVTRDGDATYPRTLHLKLFCEGGELYLDVDVVHKRDRARREGSRVPSRRVARAFDDARASTLSP